MTWTDRMLASPPRPLARYEARTLESRHRSVALSGWALVALLVALPKLDSPVDLGRITLTPGRVLIAVAGLGLVLHLLATRRFRALRAPVTIALMASVGFTVILVWASAYTNGCNCQGSAAGITEFAAVAAIAACTLSFDPRWGRRLLLACAMGAVLAAIFALPDVFSGAGGRLSGSYGNPNYLSFALALGPPILVDALLDQQQVWMRVGLVLLTLLVIAVGFVTYSRSGLIALIIGLLVVLLLRARTARGRALIVAVSPVIVALGVMFYPNFSQSRLAADISTSAARENFAQRAPGWDPYPTGLIRAGPSQLGTLPDATLLIRAPARGGASFGLGTAAAGTVYTVTLQAESHQAGSPVVLAMEDDRLRLNRSRTTVVVTARPRRYVISWRPVAKARHARLFVKLKRPGSIVLSDMTLRAGGANGAVIRLPATTVNASSLLHQARAYERSDVRFRERMLTLSWQAFVRHPLRGLGWERFPAYAARMTQYGRQATQSDWARYPAELGLGGVLVVLAMVACAVLGLRRNFPARPGVAGSLAVAAVGLAFSNALETITISAAIAVLLATASTRAGRGSSVQSRYGRWLRSPPRRKVRGDSRAVTGAGLTPAGTVAEGGAVRGEATVVGDYTVVTALGIGSALLSLVSATVITRLLLPGAFGVLSLMLVTSTVIQTLASAWTSQAVARFGRESLEVRGTMSAVTWARFRLAGPVFALGIIGVVGLKAAGALPGELTWPLVGLAIGHGAVVVAYEHMVTLLASWGRQRISGSAVLLQQVVLLGVVGALLATGSHPSPFTIGLLYTLGNAVLALAYLPMLRRVGFGFSQRDRELEARLWRFSAPLIAYTASAYVVGSVDLWVLGAFKPAHVVGTYAAAYRGYTVLMAVAAAASPVLTTLFVSLRLAGRTADLRVFAQRVCPALLLLCGSMLALLIGPAYALMPVLFGRLFQPAGLPFAILLMALLAYFQSVLLGTLLTSHDRTRQTAAANIAGAVVNVAADLVAVGLLGAGSWAPALATAAGGFVVAIGFERAAAGLTEGRSTFPIVAYLVPSAALVSLILLPPADRVLGSVGVGVVTATIAIACRGGAYGVDRDLLAALRNALARRSGGTYAAYEPGAEA